MKTLKAALPTLDDNVISASVHMRAFNKLEGLASALHQKQGKHFSRMRFSGDVRRANAVGKKICRNSGIIMLNINLDVIGCTMFRDDADWCACRQQHFRKGAQAPAPWFGKLAEHMVALVLVE